MFAPKPSISLALALAVSLSPACSGSGSRVGTDGGPPDGGAGGGDTDGRVGDPTPDGGGMDGSTAESGDGATDASVDGPSFQTLGDGATVFATNDAGQVLCGTAACACGDGEDNDGDGLVDGFDPECTGPYDNDEDSFATGIPGDNKDPRQDCFFDGNSGSGGGDCMIHEACLLDRESEACTSSFTGKRTLESEEMKCENFCEPRTPNGCDCFGCCEVFTESGSTAVLLDPECQVEIDDNGQATLSAECRTCTPSVICGNECGECELCLGRTVDDLPDSCSPPAEEDAGIPTETDGGTVEEPPTYECVDGAGNPQPTCSLEDPCPAGYYCSQGCCIPQLI